jgi:hypothetical protein
MMGFRRRACAAIALAFLPHVAGITPEYVEHRATLDGWKAHQLPGKCSLRLAGVKQFRIAQEYAALEERED